MQRKSLSSPGESPDLDRYAEIIKSGRYFRKISLVPLKGMLRHGEFVTLNAEEYLLRENHNKPPELIVLLEGSLVVTAQDNFIMRLNNSGDVVGEMSIISSNPKPFTDVIAEDDSQVVIFPNHLFKVAEDDTKVSVAYYIFSHILAEKLRHVTAQTLLKKNARTHDTQNPLIAILDPDKESRGKIKSALENVWKKACVIELEFQEFLAKPFQNDFDFLIIDPENIAEGSTQTDSIRNLIQICSSHLAPMLVISQFCKEEEKRQFLAGLGVADFLQKTLFCI